MDSALHTTSSNFNSCLDHHVFISFRGEDTRMKFVGHLEKALCDKQIKVYIDEKTLEKGEEISSALLNAIKKSKISIIIFSENYASSTWCLDELVHILKCREESGQIVVPIFYGVDPSQVRKQEGSFAHAFVAHQQSFEDRAEKLQEWKTALTMASNISGWESRNRNESKLVEEIVEYVVSKVRQRTTADFKGQEGMNRQHQKSESSSMSSYTSSRTKGEYYLKIEDLKGIKRHLERFEPLFDVGSPDVRMLGIWGMGGIGKTTLAEVIFRTFSSRFEVRLFLANIREKSKRFGLAYLEYKLFSELLKEESIDMADHSIKDRIRRKNVLLVLDDVDNSQQVERLARDHTWFGSGSRIIITTRNRHLLRCCCADAIYEVDGLNFDEALELFRFYASRGRSFIPGYAQLSQSVVHYAHGLPLALKLLGCSLYGKSRKVWESTLDKLKDVPLKEIYKVLRVSYDELDDLEKDIFLDIACFLRGRDTDFVARILEKFGSVARIGIAVLVDKSLISVKGDGEIYMHNSIRGMAWEIDRQSTKKRERNYWLSINKGIEAEGRHFEELSLGRRVSGKRYESKSSEEIVEKVASKLSYASLRTTTSPNGLVGINRQLKKIESLFGVGSPDVRVLGIWGMGGIGKTTLARVIFNRYSSQFEGCCFLKNIREESMQRGLAYLEHKLFSELLKEEDVIRPFVKYQIQPKRVLIVLDDVDDLHQIERLARDHNWFGSGSRLIITTRDRSLLRRFAVDEIYEVDGLNFDEALELFCLNAFRGRPFISGYAQLSQSIVHYAHGIPLALKVLGSFLCGRSIREWESELNKLRCVPSNDIYKVLRVSYDELASTERDIFLDIARFLEGRNRDFVERKLEEFGLCATTGIDILIDKSLISIKGDGEIYVHSLIRGMAWEIDRLTYRKHERNYESSFNKGIGAEGRDFDMSNIDYEDLLRRSVLGKRYHGCYDYPQKSLPSKISPHNLVELGMPSIKLKEYWNEVQDTSSNSAVRIYISYEGQWRRNWGCWSFDGQKAKGMTVSKDITYHELVEKISRSLMVDQSQYNLDMRYLVDLAVPTAPVEIQNDEDVEVFICETSGKGSPRYPLCVTWIKKDIGQHLSVNNGLGRTSLLFQWGCTLTSLFQKK